MIILVCHNHYQQPGGEDESAALEIELLRSYGHEVVEYIDHNDRIQGMAALHVAARTIWSTETYQRARALIQRTRPDVMHVHNFFPLISPSIYYAARAEGVPVVQTLHNYRLLCPGALFLRDGKVCEDCLGKRLPLPAIQHACYRGSRAGSAVVAGMLSVHHLLNTWARAVDSYIALTEFGRKKFIEGGLPADRIVVKPNCLHPDPGVVEADRSYHLYVGRLSEEKGIATLLEAWRELEDVPLRIVGDGPLAEECKRYIADNGLSDTVQLLGHVSYDEVIALLRHATTLLSPSICYEGLSRVAVEAFACGVPVIASRIGALQEVVEDHVQGLLVRPGDAAELTRALRWTESNPEQLTRMGKEARARFQALFDGERNYALLIEIYQTAIDRFRSRTSWNRRSLAVHGSVT